jgi:integrase
MEQVGPTKTRRSRRLTVGTTTATLWHDVVQVWSDRMPDGEPLGMWLFSSDLAHRNRLTTSHLAHSFARLRASAAVPDISLHRLRHGVATFLVDRGEILKAQHRLGHRDPSTTLRNYAHAMPLEDQAVADAIDELLASRQDHRSD